jgi:hypothetical protein
MTQLTLALGCLGVALIGAAVLHGVWQARKAAGLSPLQPAPRQPHQEPILAQLVPSSVTESSAITVCAEGLTPGLTGLNELAAIHNDSMVLPSAFSLKRSLLRIDALLDAIATLSLDTPITANSVLMHLPSTCRAGSKPFLIEGLNAQSQQWEPPFPGQHYRQFQAGVQLANRTGVLNEIEYSEFIQKIQNFADLIGASADFPDMLDVMGRAKELDTFASQHDAQLTVYLRARTVPWSVGYVQQYAAKQGFGLQLVPGRLAMLSPEEGAPAVLTLQFDAQAALADYPSQSAIQLITLNFDVPQTAADHGPFALWTQSAQALARDMDALLVDDQGQPLSASSFESIGARLEQLYLALEQHDLAAGSMLARRLFA